MDLHTMKIFMAVARERSFSRAAEKTLRTQPAVSLAIQRLEGELGEKLIDRTGKEPVLTDAGRMVLEYANRFENMEHELETALAELHDVRAGRLSIGANESTTLYLIGHIMQYRRLYPRVKVQVRRCLSSKIPTQIVDGDLELGVISYSPADDQLQSAPLFTDHLAFVVSPRHRFARRKSIPIAELGMETFIAHNVHSPVCPCTWTWRCPPSRPSRSWCSAMRASPSCRGCAWSRSCSRRRSGRSGSRSSTWSARSGWSTRPAGSSATPPRRFWSWWGRGLRNR